jgi:hypothetical protein
MTPVVGIKLSLLGKHTVVAAIGLVTSRPTWPL